MAKSALLAMLANQLIGLLRIPDTNMASAVMGLVRAMNKESNTNEDLVNINTMTIESPERNDGGGGARPWARSARGQATGAGPGTSRSTKHNTHIMTD